MASSMTFTAFTAISQAEHIWSTHKDKPIWGHCGSRSLKIFTDTSNDFLEDRIIRKGCKSCTVSLIIKSLPGLLWVMAQSAQQPEEGGEDIIENPITGERIQFLDPPSPGEGDLLRFEFWGQPHIVGPMAHIHPKQEEYFEVIDGTLSAQVGKRDLLLKPGQSMTIPAGTSHTWWNSGDEVVHGYVELTPSMDMHDEFEALFALGRAGRTNEHGVPNLLQTAVLLDRYPNTIYRAGLPMTLQKLGIKMLAPIGRLRGYKVRYPELVGAIEAEEHPSRRLVE